MHAPPTVRARHVPTLDFRSENGRMGAHVRRRMNLRLLIVSIVVVLIAGSAGVAQEAAEAART
jgi:hypothetical protein